MPATTTGAAEKPCARDRLLAAADELFYAEGVQTVGIDRVIERAGVAKASLYNSFGSKDALVRAYLEARHDRTRAAVLEEVERHDDPRERLVAVFARQARRLQDADYHGCAFTSASAEAVEGSGAREATQRYRTWLRELLADLARQAGAADPEALGRQLQLVYDGVGASGRVEHDEATGRAALSAATALIDAAISR
ncbi:putative transcriptional regulator, TetR family protein [Marmoricola endophyticus]|uniref:Transcriptional regulator, TetR family protein n=1 Tax=Marmoricola endophyticus TaxID=2040280 RepID=A0A917BIR1_9ACTN|nr:TetR/AcrR family transcriptional regulator [Marmoricola endophyticus]GGF41875.1 putative transcriptional regulator, TetR family protein [Marmoricola endophyticus]